MAREDLGVGLGGLESGPSFYYLLTPPTRSGARSAEVRPRRGFSAWPCYFLPRPIDSHYQST